MTPARAEWKVVVRSPCDDLASQRGEAFMDLLIVAPVDLPIKDAGLWPTPPSAFAEATADKSAVLCIIDRQVDPAHLAAIPSTGCTALRGAPRHRVTTSRLCVVRG